MTNNDASKSFVVWEAPIKRQPKVDFTKLWEFTDILDDHDRREKRFARIFVVSAYAITFFVWVPLAVASLAAFRWVMS